MPHPDPHGVQRFMRHRQGTFAPSEALGLVGYLRSVASIGVSGLPVARWFALAELIREAAAGRGDSGQ